MNRTALHLLTFALTALFSPPASALDIIPRPASVETAPNGPASRPVRVRIAEESPPALREVAALIAEELGAISGKAAPVRLGDTSGAVLRLTLETAASTSPEGYTLRTDRDGAHLESPTPAGLYRGWQTLRAALEQHCDLGSFTVRDAPRFRWRGLHLDESRHFFGKAFVKRTLDLMARHKLNTFHWHLTDGPGWRLEIPEYPRLTGVGAWRRDKTDRPWDWRATELSFEGGRPGDYGGFYTESDIREILAYAKARFITVVPEIEMPGHAYAALVAYPEFACENNAVHTEGLRGKDVFCAGNPATFAFAETVLRRVCELFADAPYIHIGGDEVSPLAWNDCPKCRERLRSIGGKDAHDLQADFTRRIAGLLRDRGRRAMGWDEIAAGPPIPSDAAVMVWRDAAFARRALERGHDVVLTPISHLYFDLPERRGPGEPRGADGITPLEKVYGYEPVEPGLPEPLANNILGVQACLWTEHITTPALADHRLLPRLCALSEIAWSPAASRDTGDFLRRLGPWSETLRQAGYRCKPRAEDASAPKSATPKPKAASR